jgi:hypothetical protein
VNEEALAHCGLLRQKKEMEDSGEMLEEPADLVCIYELFLPSVSMCVGSKYGNVVDSDNCCDCQQVN